MDLWVVTPCARPGNLGAVAQSIGKASVPEDVTLHWLVLLDDRFPIDITVARDAAAIVPNAIVDITHASGVAGHAQRNHALALIRSGWIVFVDDDNLLHPALPATLARTIENHPDAGVVVFDQDAGGKIRRAARRNVRVGRIDSAQYALERAFVGNDRFDVYSYSADGILAESLHRRAPGKFVFVSQTLAFYNALTPDQWGETPPGRLTSGPLPIIHTAASLHFHRSFESERAPGADKDAIRLGSGVEGDRLYLTTDDGSAIFRSPLGRGKLRLSGRAWLDESNSRGGQLGICLRNPDAPAQTLVAVELRPSRLHFLKTNRWLSRIVRTALNFEAVFESDEGSEIEITFSVAAPGLLTGVVIDSLRIGPSS